MFYLFRYSVPSTPFSVTAQVGTNDLSSLINSLLKGWYNNHVFKFKLI